MACHSKVNASVMTKMSHIKIFMLFGLTYIHTYIHEQAVSMIILHKSELRAAMNIIIKFSSGRNASLHDIDSFISTLSFCLLMKLT
jgi:hypothetical protein